MKGFKRPSFVTLDASNVVPAANQVARPDRVTHETSRAARFWYGSPSKKSDGELREGTKLSVKSIDDRYARVIDERGFEVTIDAEALKAL